MKLIFIVLFCVLYAVLLFCGTSYASINDIENEIELKIKENLLEYSREECKNNKYYWHLAGMNEGLLFSLQVIQKEKETVYVD